MTTAPAIHVDHLAGDLWITVFGRTRTECERILFELVTELPGRLGSNPTVDDGTWRAAVCVAGITCTTIAVAIEHAVEALCCITREDDKTPTQRPRLP